MLHPETRIQHPRTVIHLTLPCHYKEPSRFTNRLSRDPTAAFYGLSYLGIASGSTTEQALLDWVSIDSHFCSIQLNGTVRT